VRWHLGMAPGLDDGPDGAEDHGRVEDVDLPRGLRVEVGADVQNALDERAAVTGEERHAEAGEVND
jgi:hypothetical protein